jgi:hypothetical protein
LSPPDNQRVSALRALRKADMRSIPKYGLAVVRTFS